MSVSKNIFCPACGTDNRSWLDLGEIYGAEVECGYCRNKFKIIQCVNLPPAPATPIQVPQEIKHSMKCLDRMDIKDTHNQCDCICHADLSGFTLVETGNVTKISTFNTILDEMRSVHDKKSADYANPQDRFSNFVEAACEAGCSVDTVFRVLIGIKNSRIKQLMNSGAAPKNESLEDSILDRTVYSIIWMAWRREHGDKV